MFDYLQQFNKLPKEIREKISQPTVMSEINKLEIKYKVELAALIMKVMVKQVLLKNLTLYLVGQFDLNESQANNLSQELKVKVFSLVGDYLLPAEINTNQTVDEKEDLDILKNAKLEEPVKIDSQASIEEILKQSQIRLSSSQLMDRLKIVLKTYIKGVRDKVATRSVLIRSPQEGGLGLDQGSVDKLFKLAESHKLDKALQNKVAKPVLKVSQQAEVQDKLQAMSADYSLKQSIVEQKIEPKTAEIKDPVYELAPLPPAIVNKVQPVKEKIDLDKIEKKEIVAAEKPIEKISIPENLSVKPVKREVKEESKPEDIKPKIEPVQEVKAGTTVQALKINVDKPVVGGKQRMDDIRLADKVMSPVDELRYLNLVNFRRLGDNAESSVAKIKEKLDLLGKESYAKRIAGIEAWRKNPLNQLYLDISRESLSLGKPVKAILEKRQQEKRDYLEPEELQALVNFNRELMF